MTPTGAAAPTHFEVLTMGRVGVDIYPDQVGVGLEDVTSFGKYLGGSPTNVAVAAARHDRRSAVITRTGADPFGRFIHQALQGFGVDDRYVSEVAAYPTPVTFCEIFPPDDFPLYFYRQPKAPDLEINADELDFDAIEAADIFWVTGTGLCAEPSQSRHDGSPGRSRRPRNHDPRPRLPTDVLVVAAEAHHAIRAAVSKVDVAVGNLDECEVAIGVREPRAAADALLAAGVRFAVVKQGPAGVLGVRGSESVVVPPMPVDVVNGLGAGDAFGGALCHGLLSGWDTERILSFANAAGAMVAGRLACADAMPTTAELEALLEGARS